MTRNDQLACQGGNPVRTDQVPPWPHFDREDQEAALRALRSGGVNQWTGDDVSAFEREFARYLGANHAIAVANGTVALELALKALGIGPGDEVIVPSRTFVATASAVVAVGAVPVVADIDRTSGNLTAEAAASVLTPRTAAVIPVHVEGWPVDLEPLLELAQEHNLFVVEDCAQAHGAEYNGKKVGTIGDIGCFSFCQDKIMTSGGEGGMVVTDDADLAQRAWTYKDHGKDRHAVFDQDHPPGFRWVHHSFGTNWRLTGLQAAIGRTQLRKLDAWLDQRHRNATVLTKGLRDLPGLRVPELGPGIRHAFYKYTVYVQPPELAQGWTRDRVMEAIAAEGVPCRQGICSEIYREKAFQQVGRGPKERHPVAAELQDTSIQFLVHPTQSEADMADVVAAATKVMTTAVGPGSSA